MSRPSPATKNALLADYQAGMSQHAAATKHGIAKSTAHKWITAAGISRGNSAAKRLAAKIRRDEELGLGAGQWVLDERRRIQVWRAA